MNFNTWVAAEADRHNVIAVRPVYVDIAGDLVSGILLGQLVYWYTPDKSGKTRLRVRKLDKDTGESHLWIARAHADWYDEIRLTERQIPRALKILENQGLIITQQNRFDGLKTTHIRLNIPVFEQKLQDKLQEMAGITQSAAPEIHNAYYRKYAEGRTEDTLCVEPLTETTTENTTENTTESTSGVQQAEHEKNLHLLSEFPNDVQPTIKEFVKRFGIPIPEERSERAYWINGARMFLDEFPEREPGELMREIHSDFLRKNRTSDIQVKSPESVFFLAIPQHSGRDYAAGWLPAGEMEASYV